MSERRSGGTGGEPQASALLALVPMAGASISTVGGVLPAETVSATDAIIARVDELQFDLGVGPCWDAVASGGPVFEPDLRGSPRRVWHGFSEAVLREPIGALFAIPMIVGPLRIGAVDLYDVRPRRLDGADLARTVDLAAELARLVLRRALVHLGPDDAEPERPHSRRTIHQATGFVIAQADVSAEEAELLIRASAYAEGTPMHVVAEQIVSRQRSFSRTLGAIEDDR